MDNKVVYDNLDYLFSTGRINEIEPYLKTQLLEAYENDEYDCVIILLNELMSHYRTLGKTDKSITSAEELRQLLKELKIEGTMTYASSCLNIVTAYVFAGKDKEAISLSKEVEAIFTKNIPEDDYRMASIYNNISIAYQHLKDFENALIFAQKALEIMNAKPDSAAERAVTNTNIGLIYLKKNELRAAWNYINKALLLFEHEASDDPHYASALSASANCYYLQGKYQQSAERYEIALQMTEKHYGKSKDYGTTCINYADALARIGEKERAEKFRQLGFSIFNSSEEV